MADECVNVCVRCRPFNDRERDNGSTCVLNFDLRTGTVAIQNPKADADVKTFSFDSAFDWNASQVDVYNRTAKRIVESVLNGFNGTVFVYGQTGSGKTFSMQGVNGNREQQGIIPQSFNEIFSHIARTPAKQYLVRVSYLEIYNEEIRDLLVTVQGNKKPVSLELKENPEKGVYVKDLSSKIVKSVEEMEELMFTGNRNRSVGATLMNAVSSRSHSIFTINVECCETNSKTNEQHFFAGKLHLVDLAGSERQSKTGATGDRLKEASKINLSLSALGNCISALVDGKSTHVPYRDSKLTRLLQDSLGGNSRTLMLATLSPASFNYDETLSTLRYANRAKNIKNTPKVNEDPKDAMLREMQDEIVKLRKILEDRARAKSPELGGAGEGAEVQVVKRIVTRVVKKRKDKSGGDAVGQQRSSAVDGAGLDGEEDESDASEADVGDDGVGVLEAGGAQSTTEQQLELERASALSLKEKLEALESSMLVGGVNIFEHIDQQERALEERAKALEQERARERDLEEQLESRQEAALQMEGHFSTLAEEVEVKTRKLEKLWSKVQTTKQEIEELQDEFRADREELLDTIRELSRELALKTAVVENFVPEDERLKIEARAMWNGEREVWTLGSSQQVYFSAGFKMRRPVSTPGLRRPMTLVAKMLNRKGVASARYRQENLINVNLELPENVVCESGMQSERSAWQDQ
ncbi:kinesin-domain-containing protein [Gonapodya prolifera JEL478]|uniref:Kinesin-like protein n=1 Tax=Gonapodya prolifera (strain JEL478) TaxID=1344416 RepID=A0A138ZXF0_GONPJ|nr:kinesin-domain-containing protein [Gonapodya prolifera JEL478]|eukprot:KXS09168.1 kinesin-domain-containing protein [Gonapodya prolifera JEL478]